MTTDIRTEANYIEVRGQVNEGLFLPNFTCPDVWLTEDRLLITYAVDYGYRVEVVASITRTADGFTLVGAHSTFNGEPAKSTTLVGVDTEDTRLALLAYAGKVDALTKEFIVPQVLRALVLAELEDA